MIPLVINSLMSTCFRGAQNPADRADRTPTSRSVRETASATNVLSQAAGLKTTETRYSEGRPGIVFHFLQAVALGPATEFEVRGDAQVAPLPVGFHPRDVILLRQTNRVATEQQPEGWFI